MYVACANGHLECVQLLVNSKAFHNPNLDGNYPLHWAVQNGHLDIVRLLLKSYKDIDVLEQNGFGRGCVTEAFQSQNTEMIAMLLEHPTATEERLLKGTGQEAPKFEDVVQQAILNFQFEGKDIPIREIALEGNEKVFDKTADEDSTGITVWSASIILAHWIADMKMFFHNKTVMELGAGCGLAGIVAGRCTSADKVVVSDLFQRTMENLHHNVEMNRTDTLPLSNTKCCQCQQECGDQRLVCARCTIAQYCSKECQKASWSMHKRSCVSSKTQLIASALDWEQVGDELETYNIVMGSDLVYHEDIVPLLVAAIDQLLTEDGTFFHVASQQRSSLGLFIEQMKASGFQCKVEIVPHEFKQNPLVGGNAENLFHLHFNEMEDDYFLYTFIRI